MYFYKILKTLLKRSSLVIVVSKTFPNIKNSCQVKNILNNKIRCDTRFKFSKLDSMQKCILKTLLNGIKFYNYQLTSNKLVVI